MRKSLGVPRTSVKTLKYRYVSANSNGAVSSCPLETLQGCHMKEKYYILVLWLLGGTFMLRLCCWTLAQTSSRELLDVDVRFGALK